MEPAHTRASRRTPALVVLVLALCLAVAAGGLLAWRQAHPAQALHLEPAGDTGAAPFLDAAHAEPATFSDTVRASVIEASARRSVAPATGTRTAAGDSPGLYAHIPQSTVCDVAGLEEALLGDPTLATAWSGVRGLIPDQIPEYLAGLTALHLTVDTLVTNHRWQDGVAVPFAAVLQSGTAVLVDDRGQPVVRCACGNPLAEAPEVDVSAAATTGTAWQGFDTAAIHTVDASPQAHDTFRAVHVDTAELVDVTPAGAAPAPLFIVTQVDTPDTGPAATTGAPSAPTSGSIRVSEDGSEWEEVLQTSALYGVEASTTMAVAVGRNPQGGGIIHTSNDGRTWSQAHTVIDPLVDVAHGEGVWVAVGNRSFAEESGEGDGSSGAVYLSEDGATWERVATTDPYENTRMSVSGEFMFTTVRSVAFGAGTWIMTASECAYRTCELVEFTSSDARTWTRHFLDTEILRVDAHHDGTTWGFVGDTRDPTGIEENMASRDRPLGLVGTGEDGLTWRTGAPSPERIRLAGLASGPSGWYALDAEPQEISGVKPSPGRIHVSTDLLAWEVFAEAGEGATGLAVLGGRASTAPATSATPAATTSPAPSPDPDAAVRSIEIHTQGIALVGESQDTTQIIPFEGPVSAAVDALTDLLGAPRTAFHAGDGYCSADTRETAWSGLSIYHPDADASAPWRVRMSGASRGGGDVALPVTTPQGVSVGMGLEDAVGRSPGAVRSGWDHEGVRWERLMVDLDAEGSKGTEVVSEDGVITSIGAPVWVEGDC